MSGPFFEEATELLQALEDGALTTPPPLDAMFRAAHTLKGSGGMLGLTGWVERAHRLEDAMDRRGKPDWAWTADLKQLALDTVDAISAELRGEASPDAPVSEGWEVRFDSLIPGARAYQALMQVRALTSRVRAEPPEDALAAWSGTVFRLWVPSGVLDLEALKAVLSQVDDVVSVSRLGLDDDSVGLVDSVLRTREPRLGANPDQREGTIRISPDILESISEGLGELLLDQGQLAHRLATQVDSVSRGLLDRLRRRALDLQDLTLRTRLLPLDTPFRQYPRAIHDIAQKLDKRIQLITSGGETELDRLVMDRLHEPILHLLRNSADHGIETPRVRRLAGKPETGTIRLTAYAGQGHVHVRVEDDGGGIDWQKLRDRALHRGWMTADETRLATEDQLAKLLFRPGVSTRDQITDLSGRGVGLDVVQSFLEEIHGVITVESILGQGIVFHLELPMTMAMMTALIVEAGPWTVGLPTSAVERVERLSQAELSTVLGRDVVPDHETLPPVYSLATLLDAAVSHQDRYLVRVKEGSTKVVLTVGGVLGQQKVVIRPVAGLMALTPWLSGVALLGDERLALMVDVRRLVPKTEGDVATAPEATDGP